MMKRQLLAVNNEDLTEGHVTSSKVESRQPVRFQSKSSNIEGQRSIINIPKIKMDQLHNQKPSKNLNTTRTQQDTIEIQSNINIDQTNSKYLKNQNKQPISLTERLEGNKTNNIPNHCINKGHDQKSMKNCKGPMDFEQRRFSQLVGNKIQEKLNKNSDKSINKESGILPYLISKGIDHSNLNLAKLDLNLTKHSSMKKIEKAIFLDTYYNDKKFTPSSILKSQAFSTQCSQHQSKLKDSSRVNLNSFLAVDENDNEEAIIQSGLVGSDIEELDRSGSYIKKFLNTSRSFLFYNQEDDRNGTFREHKINALMPDDFTQQFSDAGYKSYLDVKKLNKTEIPTSKFTMKFAYIYGDYVKLLDREYARQINITGIKKDENQLDEQLRKEFLEEKKSKILAPITILGPFSPKRLNFMDWSVHIVKIGTSLKGWPINLIIDRADLILLCWINFSNTIPTENKYDSYDEGQKITIREPLIFNSPTQLECQTIFIRSTKKAKVSISLSYTTGCHKTIKYEDNQLFSKSNRNYLYEKIAIYKQANRDKLLEIKKQKDEQFQFNYLEQNMTNFNIYNTVLDSRRKEMSKSLQMKTMNAKVKKENFHKEKQETRLNDIQKWENKKIKAYQSHVEAQMQKLRYNRQVLWLMTISYFSKLWDCRNSVRVYKQRQIHKLERNRAVVVIQRKFVDWMKNQPKSRKFRQILLVNLAMNFAYFQIQKKSSLQNKIDNIAGTTLRKFCRTSKLLIKIQNWILIVRIVQNRWKNHLKMKRIQKENLSKIWDKEIILQYDYFVDGSNSKSKAIHLEKIPPDFRNELLNYVLESQLISWQKNTYSNIQQYDQDLKSHIGEKSFVKNSLGHIPSFNDLEDNVHSTNLKELQKRNIKTVQNIGTTLDNKRILHNSVFDLIFSPNPLSKKGSIVMEECATPASMCF